MLTLAAVTTAKNIDNVSIATTAIANRWRPRCGSVDIRARRRHSMTAPDDQVRGDDGAEAGHGPCDT